MSEGRPPRVWTAESWDAGEGMVGMALVSRSTNPLDYACAHCSAAIGIPCHDRQFVECGPHMGRLGHAGLLPPSRGLK